MNVSTRIVLAGLTLAAGVVAANRELLVSGGEEVYILDLSQPSKPIKVFSWRAAEHPEVPAALHRQFHTTDDCKMVRNRQVLITSSSGGVALVERPSGRALFWAHVANAHSAELLPGNRIVVAASVHDQGGNRLVLFDTAEPDQEINSVPLHSAHGVVWDERRQVLWALGGEALETYTLSGWNSNTPALKKTGEWKLPIAGGHELSPADERGQYLLVSARDGVWLFDCQRKSFTLHPVFGKIYDLKSASLHPETGQWAYTVADPPDWWTTTIRFSSPTATIVRTGERLYKVRWVARRSAYAFSLGKEADK